MPVDVLVDGGMSAHHMYVRGCVVAVSEDALKDVSEDVDVLVDVPVDVLS